jgi:DNA-binding transcriptional ArsR family regulator
MPTLQQPIENPIVRLTTLLRAVCDETRLRLLLLLAEGERDVGTLCAAIALPQPTVSHHLALLLMQQLVAVRREGKRRLYSLDESVASTRGEVLDLRIEGALLRIFLSQRDVASLEKPLEDEGGVVAADQRISLPLASVSPPVRDIA